MKLIKKVCKPTSIFLAIVFFMFPAFQQTASAAMVGTELMLTANRHLDTRGYLRDLLSRQEIQKELVFHGIDPDEARARIESLSDDELAMIAPILADLPAGGDGTGVAVIGFMVIMLIACFVQYFKQMGMFPNLFSDD